MNIPDRSVKQSVDTTTNRHLQEEQPPDTSSGLGDFYVMRRAIEKPSKETLTPHGVLQLQRMIGNQRVLRFLSGSAPKIQNSFVQRQLDNLGAKNKVPDNEGTITFLNDVVDKYQRGKFKGMSEDQVEEWIYGRYSQTGGVKFSNQSGGFSSDMAQEVFSGKSWNFSEQREKMPSKYRMMIRFREGADLHNVAWFISQMRDIADSLRPHVTSYKSSGKEESISDRTDPLIIYTSLDPNDVTFTPLHQFISDYSEIVSYGEGGIGFYKLGSAAPFYWGEQPTEELKEQGMDSFGSIFSRATAKAIETMKPYPFMQVDTGFLSGEIQRKGKIE